MQNYKVKFKTVLRLRSGQAETSFLNFWIRPSRGNEIRGGIGSFFKKVPETINSPLILLHLKFSRKGKS